MKTGLVLTGGGARAAYQTGVVKALAEIAGHGKSPFQILTGVSAGAINSAYLMSYADDFSGAADGLHRLWCSLESERIYRSDPAAVATLGSRWLRTLGLGGWAGRKPANYLLNTGPLRQLLEQELRLDRIPGFIQDGILRGVAFSCTNYLTGTAISFYDGHDDIQPWVRSTRLGQRERLTNQHVMASSAIPVFFPPERLDGALYGDGCIRLTSPLSPAIHLGADRIIAVGIRYFRTNEQTLELNRSLRRDDLSIAEIGGVLLNAVFLDSLETDIERMERINNTLSLMTEEQRRAHPSALKQIPILALRPSRDLGQLARGTLKEFPALIRYLLRGVGAQDDKGWDLVSYLAFEATYTSQLAELGYEDTLARKRELQEFLFGGAVVKNSKSL
jgi:NTE family protein